MPRFGRFLHYRLIDVSSVKELAKRWNPKVYLNAPEKLGEHRAFDDIIDSINELKYYRDNFLIENLDMSFGSF
jgi:oligoribonuclease